LRLSTGLIKLSFHAAFFPMEPIEFAPVLPIPGDHDRQTKAPLMLFWPSHPLPSYMGQTFPSLGRIWVILQEIDTVYTLKDMTPLVDRVPLAFAESKYKKLLSWADTLGPEMHRSDHSPSHVYFFQ
jgi:hypothetical protein